MKKFKLSLLLVLFMSMTNVFAYSGQATYYTWMDESGVVQITTTPPPENIQLHTKTQVVEEENSQRAKVLRNMNPFSKLSLMMLFGKTSFPFPEEKHIQLQ